MEKSEKRQRFEKVASGRVQKIVDTLSLLANCANRSNYEYNEHDVEFMYNEISKALKESRAAYIKEFNKASRPTFAFK
ncbi:MAG: hypothetical protein K2K45_03175 [Muribaculaceae bacterium]|nr:hypothetical protein [Muribaculaceae bacterium]